MSKQQRPTPPNEWLTRLLTHDEKDREFAKVLSLPDGATPWDECTNEEKEEWEREHRPEDPEEVQDAEEVKEE